MFTAVNIWETAMKRWLRPQEFDHPPVSWLCGALEKAENTKNADYVFLEWAKACPWQRAGNYNMDH